MGTLLQAITMATFTNLIALSLLLGMVLTVSSFKLEERKSTASWVSLCDEGHSYLFSEETADWAESSVMCEELGGYLVRIENRHENNCILVHAQKQGLHHYWWTSGNDRETEGYYVFQDGTEMDWVSFWINNEGASSDGIVISTMDAGDAGGWARKVTSYDTYPYICERDD